MVQQKLGWFNTAGRPGDRTLKDQLVGLDTLIARVSGKTVLDVGCAEGLISLQLFDEGAVAVHGVEIVQGHVDVANKLRGDRACTFEQGDADHFMPKRQYDIVIMLALLQKLRNPTMACRKFAAAARELVVLRLPPRGDPLMLVDQRSGYIEHDIREAMLGSGFVLADVVSGHLGEHISYWERK
jgi:SAM-dependent methyltransferase